MVIKHFHTIFTLNGFDICTKCIIVSDSCYLNIQLNKFFSHCHYIYGTYFPYTSEDDLKYAHTDVEKFVKNDEEKFKKNRKNHLTIENK